MGEPVFSDHRTADLAVVIPSYNSVRTLPHCLNALLAQNPIPREIIVVDSSPVFPVETYRQQYPSVRFIHLGDESSPGRERNIGAAASSAAVIAFLDADCIVSPDWTRAVMEVLRRHPEQGVFVGALRNGNPQHVFGWLSFLSEFSGYIGRPKRRRVACLPSFCLVIRQEVFVAAGGFPEDVWPGEDTVLSRRLLQQGHMLVIEPTVRVAHINRTRYRDFLRHQFRLGQSFAMSRQRMSHLPGGKYYTRSAGYLPLMAAYRSLLTMARLLRDYPEGLLLFILLFPAYVPGLAAWTLGALQQRRKSHKTGTDATPGAGQ